MSDDLWEAVQQRSAKQSNSSPGNKNGRHPKYLLSGLLKCECGANYILRKGQYYGCGAHHDRGPGICDNGRLAPRERLERVILDAIFNEVFIPEVLTYLDGKVNDALAMATSPDATRKKRQADLAQARRKLDNIKSAIEQGVVTATTKKMLEEAENRVEELETSMRGPERQRKVVYLPGVVETCLRDLKGSLDTDPDEARRLLAKLLGRITLRRDGERLNAEFQGNLLGLLEIDARWKTLVPEDRRRLWQPFRVA